MGSMQMTRPRCNTCARPHKTCLCDLVQVVNNACEILILQHPREEFEAKGTGRLLHLCLNRSKLVVGEQFSGEALTTLFGDQKTNILLFPPSEDSPLENQQVLSASDAKRLNVDKLDQGLRLVIIDGTWRKARKMLHLSPLLAALPRLQLSPRRSRYHIRKAQRAGQLSSLEAAYWALAEMGEPHDELLLSFERFLNRQAIWREDTHTE